MAAGDKTWETSQTGGLSDEIAWSPRLGAHLEASRKRANLRRLDLATTLQVSEETIRLWERGTVQPSTERLARLIALLALETSDWPADTSTAPELPPLARRLRAEREGRGITQAAVVKILDVPQATYAGWETGRTTPGGSYFARIAGFLGVPESDVSTLCASPFIVDYAAWPPLGQFMGARRQELRLTRSALAAALDVSQGTVVAWELGYRVPGTAQLTRLAHVLEVEPASLVAALPRRATLTSLGDLIQARQRELGMRSVDLARAIGTTEATVSRWVHGRSQPVPKNLERLANALRLPYAHLVEAAGAAT
jgi:transcriptional regulator with XRE-family HTH domain